MLTSTQALRVPAGEIKQTKEQELVYLVILLALLGLPRTVRQAQAVLQKSSGQWQLTRQDIAEMWPGRSPQSLALPVLEVAL